MFWLDFLQWVLVGWMKDSSLLSCLPLVLFFTFFCLPCPLSLFLGFLSTWLHLWFSPPSPQPPYPLCSGDSPEQRSAASGQRPHTVLALSGDHQWDLHPRPSAKLAGGLSQSHTHHHHQHPGVCVATHRPAPTLPPSPHRVSPLMLSCPRLLCCPFTVPPPSPPPSPHCHKRICLMVHIVKFGLI